MFKNKHIAIYGGSFDPPHIAHVEIIKETLKKIPLDFLVVMVAYQNPLKSNTFFEDALRLKWMQKVCSNFDRVVVSDFEIQNQICYSIDTIRYFEESYMPKSITLILGEDNLLSLHRWKDYEILKQKVHFVFVKRRGFEYNVDKTSCLQIELENITFPLSSSLIKEDNKMISSKFIPQEIVKDVLKNMEGRK